MVGYRVVQSTLDQPAFRHAIGGVSQAACPSCAKPFTRLAHLDASDPRVEWTGPSIDLIYCYRCPAAFEPLRYHLAETGVVLDSVNRGPLETDDFPYENYPISFPEIAVALNPFSAEEEATLVRYRELDSQDHSAAVDFKYADQARADLLDAHHQALGTPYWSQPDLAADCHLCGGAMFHLATICDNSFSSKPFVGNIGVQVVFFACRNCKAIAALQDCD